MSRIQLAASATFGLEAVVKREIEALGYRITSSEDGRICYEGDERAIVRSNLWLRCADRVYMVMGRFRAESFEELFQQTKALPWPELIPIDGKFTVIGTSVKSILHSVPACQSIIKKAIVERMKETYAVEEFAETGASYTVRFAFLKDEVIILVDTSGEGLHKRGYRTQAVTAPIKETLAAAMVQLSFFKAGRLLVDPMCGSGTIPIEAAMIARNIAPGLSRHFASEDWDVIDPALWKEERSAAFKAIDSGAELRILASDIDKKSVEAARENALEAGVDDCIDFRIGPMQSMLPRFFSEEDEPQGIIITNPPYGQRIGDQEEMDRIYRSLKDFMKDAPGWSLFMISADKTAEKKLGRPADRRRKLYNGNIESCYYQYHGKKIGK